jgi:hypothetical protein
MSNPIQLRRGLESERVGVVFSAGEPVYCTDSYKLYVGDGLTPGGRLISGGGGGSQVILDTYANIHVQTLAVGTLAFATDLSKLYVGNGITVGGIEVKANDYVRNGFSKRFSENVTFNTIQEALDYILDLALPIPESFYWGEMATNGTIADGTILLGSLASQAWAAGAKSVNHVSSSTYRVFAYPKSKGAITDIQDPGFMNASIRASYELTPREITVAGTVYYVYVSADQYDSPAGQAVKYITA